MSKCFCLQLLLSTSLFVISSSAFSNVKISNLDDINFGLYSGFGNLRHNENICINTIPMSNYRVTIWGSGASGAFVVSNGLKTIPFEVKYRNRTGNGNSGTNMSPGIPLTNQNRSSSELNCPSGLNANINVGFARKDLQAASSGRYSGRLTITIAPE
jgi:hypothetical protein